jgi:hypothetical protein
VEDHHVALRREHDHRRVLSIRRQRAAVSEKAEVRSDVFALEAREPDHLDQVSVIDQVRIESLGEEFELSARTLRIAGTQNGRHRPWSVAAGIDARVLHRRAASSRISHASALRSMEP